MRAVTHQRYGDAGVLEVTEVPVPVAKAGEVLVRVSAASLNPADKFMMLGAPAPIRLMMGLARPAPGHRVRGHDLAGTVVSVGEGVTRLQVGAQVFGSTGGALAEFACGKEKVFAVKPPGLSFEHAAAMPMAALAALHGLRDAAKLTSGQHVLINGASGGIGTFAVQIAKAYGAEVTGVCSTANVGLVRDLGADHVIDYTQRPLTASDRRYDVIFDNVGNHGIGVLRRLLTPTGTLLPNSGESGPDGGAIARVLKARWHDLIGRQRVRSYLSTPNADDLALLAGMAADGTVTPVIGRTYPLEETADAMAYLAGRHVRGKVVITVPAA